MTVSEEAKYFYDLELYFKALKIISMAPIDNSINYIKNKEKIEEAKKIVHKAGLLYSYLKSEKGGTVGTVNIYETFTAKIRDEIKILIDGFETLEKA